jgi:hypothetical protein
MGQRTSPRYEIHVNGPTLKAQGRIEQVKIWIIAWHALVLTPSTNFKISQNLL